MRVAKKAKLADVLLLDDEGLEDGGDVFVGQGPHGAITREKAMSIAFDDKAYGVAARAEKNGVSCRTVRRAISAGALTLLAAQEADMQRYQQELSELIRRGGQIERVVDMLRWDETQQTLRFTSQLLQGERSPVSRVYSC